ncbi:methionyl-tRNA formyltransferase [Spirosoma utsteinense]|uniref:Methionyl-tRNA formyltransferase n=1 Tax=Spirosoma utsteinense TaxID=2585773 RepID=A0ABR6W5U6_9BACT|nr:formyltransferase family protein [Spirosoma utsteinense]MBC3786337.1 methionyl-tRNA formyltransferase [Spirosoma utsteinense]MBC3791963.1 methionyl-tRNA formyltransferase [Spirosoma utsteinense]
MRLVILTQDDPFYLARNINYLLKKLPPYAEVVATVVFDVSPFGKRESFGEKMKKTYNIFGLPFFVRYGFKFVGSKLDSRNNVRKTLADRNIPLIHIEGGINKDENLEKIRAYEPDLLVSIAGNQIFKRKLLDVATHGCINLHTALLPKYRGLMPSFWVLKNGETHTGVSVFFVDEGIDSGPILVQHKLAIGSMTQAQLIDVTKKMGMDAILEAIEKIHAGNPTLIENDASQMTYFTFPTRADVQAFLAAGKRFY